MEFFSQQLGDALSTGQLYDIQLTVNSCHIIVPVISYDIMSTINQFNIS